MEEKRKTTGKFGTGFLTTRLLSEKVEVESIVQEDNEPFKKFNLTLDRSEKSIDEIIKSVSNSHAQIAEIDLQDPYEGYSPSDFNTAFKYKLDSKGISVAEKGLKDLHHSLIFTLAFLPTIKTVSVLHEEVNYELNPDVSVIDENISIYTITITTSLQKEEAKVL